MIPSEKRRFPPGKLITYQKKTITALSKNILFSFIQEKKNVQKFLSKELKFFLIISGEIFCMIALCNSWGNISKKKPHQKRVILSRTLFPRRYYFIKINSHVNNYIATWNFFQCRVLVYSTKKGQEFSPEFPHGTTMKPIHKSLLLIFTPIVLTFNNRVNINNYS